MNIKDVREMSSSELNKALRDQKEELFHLRFQHSIKQLDNPMKIVETKRTIARLLTVLRENELAEKAQAQKALERS